MFDWNPQNYSIGIEIFLRLLGVIYVVVYIPFLFQIRGLIGQKGILPVSQFLKNVRLNTGKKCYVRFPTIFWIWHSDHALLALVWAGIIMGCLLMLGSSPPIFLLLLYLIHLSITNVGQDFLSFGWETFLMEITFAAFVMTATHPYNFLGWFSLNFLLFRFYFQAGASKILSGDRTWRDLTAISYHYMTQPLPNTIAWYFHKLPMWFHKLSCLGMFCIELLVPFMIFLSPEMRFFAFILLAGLQFGIWLTGNFSYLNHLTVVFCIILLNNMFFVPFASDIDACNCFSHGSFEAISSSYIWNTVILLLASLFLVLQIAALFYPFLPLNFFYKILKGVSPFHIAYPHGIFSVMTTSRHEIVLEASMDGKEWEEFEFLYKPGNVSLRPRRVSPYQPRLDWQAWFLPFGRSDLLWFHNLIQKIIERSPEVIRLFRRVPFQNREFRYLRALVYDYQFTSWEEKSKTGNWWKRSLQGIFLSPMLCRQKNEETIREEH